MIPTKGGGTGLAQFHIGFVHLLHNMLLHFFKKGAWIHRPRFLVFFDGRLIGLLFHLCNHRQLRVIDQ